MPIDYRFMAASSIRIGDMLVWEGVAIPVSTLLFNRGLCRVLVNGSIPIPESNTVVIVNLPD